MKTFSVKTAISEAFSHMIEQLGSSLIVLVAIVCMSFFGFAIATCTAVCGYILTTVTSTFITVVLWICITVGGILFTFFVYFLSAYIPFAYTTIFVRSFDKKPVSYQNLLLIYTPENSQHYWKVFAAALAYYVLVAIGLAMLFIPGLIVMVRFRFYPQFIIAENKGIFESLSASWRMSSGNFFKIFALVILYRIVHTITAGFAGFPILLFGYPFSYAADVYVYRALRNSVTQAGPPPQIPHQ